MKNCKVKGCLDPHLAKGYCNRHYLQAKKFGGVVPDLKRFEEDGETLRIYVYDKYKNCVATSFVDLEDRQLVEKYSWWLSAGYLRARIEGKMILLHRWILNSPEGMEIDHSDGDKLNNRKKNLRICKKSDNQCNRSHTKNSKSKVKGVWLTKRGDWVAQVKYRKETYYLGIFISKDEAKKAYNKKHKELAKEFARLT